MIRAPYMQLQVHITHMHAHAHARLGLLYSVSSVGAQLCDNITDSDGHQASSSSTADRGVVSLVTASAPTLRARVRSPAPAPDKALRQMRSPINCVPLTMPRPPLLSKKCGDIATLTPCVTLVAPPLVTGHKSEKCGSYHVMMFRSCDDVQVM